MRATSTLTKQKSEQLKAAYAANDPVGFTEAAVSLRAAAIEAIELGYYSDGLTALQGLNEALRGIVAERPGDPTHGTPRTTQEFVAAVMPLFGMNSPEVSANLSLNQEIDDFLVATKIDFDQLPFDYSMGTFLFHALRLGMVEEFTTAFSGACEKLLSRQDAALEKNKSSTADCFRNSEQNVLIRVFERLDKSGIQVSGIAPSIDDKLALVLSRLSVGDSAHMGEAHLKGMQSAGMHNSLKAALRNVWSVGFNLDGHDFVGLTLSDSAYLLGMNSRMYHGPRLVRNLVNEDPDAVRKAVHPFSHKRSVCTPKHLLKSCAEYIVSADFQPEHMPVINVLMENAWDKIKKTTDFSKEGLPFEVWRAHLNAAGIPNSIQFKLPMIRDNKGAIIENELGM